MFFFFKQKTAYEIKECDWSSDVCSSDLYPHETSKSQLIAMLTKLKYLFFLLLSYVDSLYIPRGEKTGTNTIKERKLRDCAAVDNVIFGQGTAIRCTNYDLNNFLLTNTKYSIIYSTR